MANNDENNPVVLGWQNVCSESGAALNIYIRDYPGTKDLWHQHQDFGELVIVLSGNAYNDSRNKHERLRAGDVQAFPTGSVHRYSGIHFFRHYTILLQEDYLNQLPIGFHSLPNYSMLFEQKAQPSHIIHLDDSDLSEAVGLLEAIRSEYLSHRVGWKEAIYSNFCQALIFILRNAAATGQSGENTSFQIGRTIRYMSDNPSRNYTIQSLCTFAQMSESSFRHHFLELTGLSPIDYIIRLRLQRAALLIAQTDQPISAIALQTGFADNSYFARQFRAFFDSTARDFRTACRAGRLDLTEELEKLQLPPN